MAPARDKSGEWATSITEIVPNHVRVRGHDIASLMSACSFGGAVYLILTGTVPDEPVARLMDAILVSSIDHGVTPPSTLAARNAASTGAPLASCVASGILAINEHHGGAIRDCAMQLGQIVRRCEETAEAVDLVAQAVVDEMKREGRRLAGFGHRVHTDDPRTNRLLDMADEAGASGRHVEAARAVANVFARANRDLPLNVDGAIAAVLADLGFDPHVMNGVFMIARAPGLVAHAVEEQTTQRPMRRIDPDMHRYSGPRHETA
jgi:citrate synthase